jgi:DNA transformation protein
MEKLSELSDIGRKLKKKLEQAGIKTPTALKEAGSKNAYLRISSFDPGACYDMLYALEGAVEGIRWHDLPKEVKSDLCEFAKLKKV